MAKYIYPAVFTKEEEGGYSVSFPDLRGCYTSGRDLEEALYMANDVLCLVLYDLEEERAAIPIASDITDIKTSEKNEFTSLVACDTLEYRKRFDKKAVKKTLTIPAYLNNMAERDNLNFSAILQDALKRIYNQRN